MNKSTTPTTSKQPQEIKKDRPEGRPLFEVTIIAYPLKDQRRVCLSQQSFYVCYSTA